MNSKTFLYFLTILCTILICILLPVSTQNVKYKRQNRKLLLENDSMLSVTQKLHQQIARDGNNVAEND